MPTSKPSATPSNAARFGLAFGLAIVSFLTYTCVFGFRKPFTVAEFSGVRYFGVSYQTLLIISQVLGYMLSKFYGIVLISRMKKVGRWKLGALLIGVAWIALLLLAIVPAPLGMLCMMVNGYMLGFLWGIVFSYVEGRRTTDLIASVLAVSFIFAGGFTRSVAKWLLIDMAVPEKWMPFLAGAIFVPPIILLFWLLEKMPQPDAGDVLAREERPPMTGADRKAFISRFTAGIVVIGLTYVLLTIIRDVRDNYMSNMWRELGHARDYGIFTRTETNTSLIILGILCLLVLVRNNLRAFRITHLLIFAGFLTAFLSSWMFRAGKMDGVWWMQLTSLGLYMAYIPFNGIFFERMIATFRFKGNVGFLIYLVDSFGYLGSLFIMLSKEWLGADMQWTPFYSKAVVVFAAIGAIGTLYSLYYFNRKYGKSIPDASA
jgi:hypothetical protein